MAITHISFDLDGTLITLRGIEHKMWLDIVPGMYAEKEGISFKQAHKYCLGAYEKIGPDKAEWYDTEQWFKFFGFEQDWKQTLSELCQNAVVLPGAREALEKYSKTHKLVLFTNTNKTALGIKLRATGFGKYFEHAISVSSEFKLAKTTPKAYEKLVKFLGINSDELLHIGDFPKHDYEPARAAGVKSVIINHEGIYDANASKLELGEHIKRHIIKDFTELERFL